MNTNSYSLHGLYTTGLQCQHICNLQVLQNQGWHGACNIQSMAQSPVQHSRWLRHHQVWSSASHHLNSGALTMSDYRTFTITRHGRDPLNWSWTIVDCKGRSYNGFFHSQAEAEKFIDDYSDGLTNTSKFDWSY